MEVTFLSEYALRISNAEETLWQWDTNQNVTVTGNIAQVHFALKGNESAYVVPVANGTAGIPNSLLQKSGYLLAYAYTPNHTLLEEEWLIHARPVPETYPYQPDIDDPGTIQEALDAINSNIDRIDSSVFQASNHRNIYRGKNLGTAITAAQKAAISSGTFDDLFVGDYWTLNGTVYRIADIDYWYNCGDTAFTKHHLVMVPDDNMYNATMNDTNTTDGGYVGSKMFTEGLDNAKATIQAAFGNMLQTHREILINAVADGHPSGFVWHDSTVELMNEIMVYGSHIHAPAGNGVLTPTQFTIDKQQLGLFRLCPRMVNNRLTYWLRDVVSSAYFARVLGYGGADSYAASTLNGVRPVFAIG